MTLISCLLICRNRTHMPNAAREDFLREIERIDAELRGKD